ncbi:MAG: hypothetical protein WAV73_05695 [Candidatus Moraniibacteriota bacterium]
MRKSDREKIIRLGKAKRKLSKKARALEKSIRQGQGTTRNYTTKNTAANQSELAKTQNKLKSIRRAKRKIHRRNSF